MSSREAGDTLSNHLGSMQQEIRYPTKPDFLRWTPCPGFAELTRCLCRPLTKQRQGKLVEFRSEGAGPMGI